MPDFFKDNKLKLRHMQDSLLGKCDYRNLKYEEIIEEISVINSKYHLEIHSSNIVNFYRTGGVKLGSVLSCADFVNFVMKCKGYKDEEIRQFLLKNIRIIFNKPSNLRYRLAVFNHFGLFDKVFFNGYSLLSSSNYSINVMYALLKKEKFDSMSLFADRLRTMTTDEKTFLKNSYPLTNDMLKKFDNAMVNSLKEEFERKDLNKKNEGFTFNVNHDYIKNYLVNKELLSKGNKDLDQIAEKLKDLVVNYNLQGRFNQIVTYCKGYYRFINGLENIEANLNFVIFILKSKGFNDEDINQFLFSNYRILFAKPINFKVKIAIFYHFGLLDEVLFKYYKILTNSNYSPKSLYAILSSSKLYSLIDYAEVLNKFSRDELRALIEKFPLDRSMMEDYYNEMMVSLQKQYGTNIRKK